MTTLNISNVNFTATTENQIYVSANSFVIKTSNSVYSANATGLFAGPVTVNSSGVYRNGTVLGQSQDQYALGELIITSSQSAPPTNVLPSNSINNIASYPTLSSAGIVSFLDDITFTPSTVANSVFIPWDITYADGTYVLVGVSSQSSGNGRIHTSTDGVSWTARTTANLNPIYAIAYGANTFVASGRNGSIQTSGDGITWTNRSSGQATDINTVTYTGTEFIAATTSTVIASSNGTTWASRGSTTNAFDIAYGNNTLVAACVNAVRTSPTGATWTDRLSGNSAATYSSVVYGNGVFLVSDSSSQKRYRSYDNGVTWTTETGYQTPVEIIYIPGYFVAFGYNMLEFSPERFSKWIPVKLPAINVDLQTGVYGDDKLVIAGSAATFASGANLNILTTPLATYDIRTQFKVPPVDNMISGYTSYMRYQ